MADSPKKKRKKAKKSECRSILEVFPGGSVVKNPSDSARDGHWSLGWEDPLEKGLATHSTVLAWRIPWTEEPGRLQSVGLQRVRHTWASLHYFRGDAEWISLSISFEQKLEWYKEMSSKCTRANWLKQK